MMKAAGYQKFTGAVGQVMYAANELVSSFEQDLRASTQPEEILRTAQRICDLFAEKDSLKAQVTATAEQVADASLLESRVKELESLAKSLEDKAFEAEARNASMKDQIAGMERAGEDMRVSYLVMETRAHNTEGGICSNNEKIMELRIKNEKLTDDIRVMKEKQSCLIERAERTVRKEISWQYKDALLQIKEKFEKKSAETDVEIQLMEYKSNIQFLDVIFERSITEFEEKKKSVEADRLNLEAQLSIVKVSDLSLSKLDLPQVSDDLVTLHVGSVSISSQELHGEKPPKGADYSKVGVMESPKEPNPSAVVHVED